MQRNYITSIFKNYTQKIEDLDSNTISILIIFTAALGLFTELAMIRVHANMIPVLAMLKNVSLLSCFLGLGLGYALSSYRYILFPLFLPLLFLQILTLKVINSFEFHSKLGNPISEELMMGIYNVVTGQQLATVIIVALLFTLNATCFVPVGQITGRLMQKIDSNKAYKFNLFGSMFGVILFLVLSYCWIGITAWMAIVSISSVALIAFEKRSSCYGIIAAVFICFLVSYNKDTNKHYLYSPYQTLELKIGPRAEINLSTNFQYYQKILNLSDIFVANNPNLKRTQDYYELPYKLVQQMEKKRVLVVGSGTGNDVAAALRNEIDSVTAVEIDPVIAMAGKQLHPERPYQDTRVRLIVNDARAYLDKTSNQYDLIVYGLLDSHTLLSGRAIRLDSYVYTIESFIAVKNKLSNEGILSLAFVDLNPEFGKKMFYMLKQAFDGIEPLVLKTEYDTAVTYVTGRANFDRHKLTNLGFEDRSEYFKNYPATVDVSTDNWPFLYMPKKEFPLSYVYLCIPLLLISLYFLRFVRNLNVQSIGFSWNAFFLGAAFMLLETKAFTELALAIGSSFIVISAIILAILFAAYVANEFIIKYRKINLNFAFSLLLISVVLSFVYNFYLYTYFAGTAQIILRSFMLVLPIFFAGICFSSEISDKGDAASIIYANLLGAMVGGFLEYFSMLFGFNFLYLLIFILYSLAFFSVKRVKSVKN